MHLWGSSYMSLIPLILPGSGSFSLPGSADCFLGVPPMNGEQPPYHMGAQVRLSRTQSAFLRSAACHHLCACVWISLVQRGNGVVLCVCFAVQLCLNVLFLSLSGRTLNHASQKDSIVPERAGWGAHHMLARVRRLSVSLFKWLHCWL